MKALTISQPYASLIASGEKVVENRRWGTSYRGPLAIHAGKGTQYLDRDELRDYPTGCIVAVAEIFACLQRSVILRKASEYPDAMIGPYTWEWLADHEHTEGPYCWVLRDIRKLDAPLPYRGAQGLWDAPELERKARA